MMAQLGNGNPVMQAILGAMTCMLLPLIDQDVSQHFKPKGSVHVNGEPGNGDHDGNDKKQGGDKQESEKNEPLHGKILHPRG